MAIIVVNEIPKPNRPQKQEPVDYRGKVKTDLEYAWNEHLTKFEFVGYNSNSTAAQFARQEAYKLIYAYVYKQAKLEVEENLKAALKKKLGKATKYIKITLNNSAEPAITISGVTVAGVKRLFGEINWEYITNINNVWFDKYIKYYSKPEIIDELKGRWAREKFNTSKKRGK